MTCSATSTTGCRCSSTRSSGGWLAPDKLEKDDRAHLHSTRREVLGKIATSLLSHAVDRAVNDVQVLDRGDPRLIGPIEL